MFLMSCHSCNMSMQLYLLIRRKAWEAKFDNNKKVAE